MLRKIIFACATAVAVGFAVSAVSTDASAARMFGGFMNHNAGRMIAGHGHRHIGTGGLGLRRTGGRTRCLEAECGGGVAPISGEFVLRQCNMIKLPVLPPWCEGIPGAPRGKTRGLRL
jgi:hypothetical protein